MSLDSTTRGTYGLAANRIKVNIDENIHLLEPDKWPFLALSRRLAKESAKGYKFEWFEEAYMGRYVTVNDANNMAANDTAMVVDDDDEDIVAVGDLLKVVRTGEVVLVTDITPSTHTLTVTRGYGETTAASINDDDVLLVMGNASAQGADAPAEKYVDVTGVYNYTQIFRKPFSYTRTLNQTAMNGPKESARIKRQKLVEHQRDIELALFFGERYLDVTGSQPRTTTRGVDAFISTNALAIDTSQEAYNTAEERVAAFYGWTEDLFKYGSKKKVWFVSPSIATWIYTDFVQDKLRFRQADKDKTVGLEVTEMQTPHGLLQMIVHPSLTDSYDGYSYALDMDHLSLMVLQDTILRQNIQNNDADGRRDEYLTECGLKLTNEKCHGILTFS
jgi:hypothetical protein